MSDLSRYSIAEIDQGLEILALFSAKRPAALRFFELLEDLRERVIESQGVLARAQRLADRARAKRGQA